MMLTALVTHLPLEVKMKETEEASKNTLKWKGKGQGQAEETSDQYSVPSGTSVSPLILPILF